MDDSISPLISLFANSRPPVQITPSLLGKAGLSTALFPSARQQAAALANLVGQRSEPKLWPVTKTEQLHEICVEKGRLCALILHHGELKQDQARALRPLLPEFRNVHFLTLNMARYDFSLARKLPAVTRDTPRLLAMRSAAATADKGGKGRSLGARAHKEDFSAVSLREFVQSHVEGALELASLRKLPEIAWRKQNGRPKASGGKADGKADKGGKAGTARGGTASAADAEAPDYKQGQAERRRRHEDGVRLKQGAARRGGRSGQSAGGSAVPGRVISTAGGPAAAAAEGGQQEAELRRRQQMAKEEAEYLRGMFAEDDEEEDMQGGGEVGWGEEEDLLDLDDEEAEEEGEGDDSGYAERAGSRTADGSREQEDGEAEGGEEGWEGEEVLVREAVAVDGSVSVTEA